MREAIIKLLAFFKVEVDAKADDKTLNEKTVEALEKAKTDVEAANGAKATAEKALEDAKAEIKTATDAKAAAEKSLGDLKAATDKIIADQKKEIDTLTAKVNELKEDPDGGNSPTGAEVKQPGAKGSENKFRTSFDDELDQLRAML